MVEWSDAQIRILIDERKNRNVEYHNLGRVRRRFWDSIADKINQSHNTHFSGHQCKEKFASLVRDYNLMCKFLAGNARGRRTRNGTLYYDEFKSRFWERSEDEFDRIRTTNISNQNSSNIAPPSYTVATNNTINSSDGIINIGLGGMNLASSNSLDNSLDNNNPSTT